MISTGMTSPINKIIDTEFEINVLLDDKGTIMMW